MRDERRVGVMKDCERGRVKHPATHLEIAQMSDDGGRFTLRTDICLDHAWTARDYAAGSTLECHSVQRRRL